MYPVIQTKVDSIISQFLSHESKRAKLVTPDLGELLVLLSLASEITWEQISHAFLQVNSIFATIDIVRNFLTDLYCGCLTKKAANTANLLT